MKPVLGLIPLWDDDKESLWMLPGYLEGLQQAGGIPVIFPFSSSEEELTRLFSLCDGLVFTGGHDVSPEMYHQAPIPQLQTLCPKRDFMETFLLKKAVEEDMPVLGICRGIQLINAVLGGTLYQDLPLQHPSPVNHRQSAPYDLPAHEVTLLRDSPLAHCLGTCSIHVNSCHHQAIHTLAPDLACMGTAPDGLIEAVYMPSRRFLWGVQWHPEFSFRSDENSRKIFRALVAAAES